MAETFVSKDQFEEFTKRMEQGFENVDQRFEAINQRFDSVNERFNDLKTDIAGIRTDMRQMRNWLIGLFSLVVFGFIGTLVITIFKEQIFK
ncbi:hypothetical protein [Candidatus Entotheonella palauensis]|uniref:t-SNARE coiled-coil homology domain-containing protein n=1 Tax=Candidatus Entotheonella gemina TaxID=1429439 RepID=W4M6F7_9BACT|nr:hypothetical protein [Candidatus Entotheonella palauensis]ETX05516.1 MAG: hypothetical protein ETSY2_22495 [Candidatus Entotheonella gemina]